MSYLIISTAVEQFCFFWELTLVNLQKIYCQLVGVSVNAKKQEEILKFKFSDGQIIYINILNILYINKGKRF